MELRADEGGVDEHTGAEGITVMELQYKNTNKMIVAHMYVCMYVCLKRD